METNNQQNNKSVDSYINDNINKGKYAKGIKVDMPRYTDNKCFIVDAAEDDKYFFAYETFDQKIISIEITPEDYPSTSICVFTDMKDFVNSVCWHDWILGGVCYDELKNILKSVGKWKL